MSKRRVSEDRYTGLHQEYDRNRIREKPEWDSEVDESFDIKAGLCDFKNIVFDSELAYYKFELKDEVEYPEQDDSIVGQTYHLRFIDYKINEIECADFKVIRSDAASPYLTILINTNRYIMLVTTKDRVIDNGSGLKDDDGIAISNCYVHEYPLQRDDCHGLPCKVKPGYATQQLVGTIIRCDSCGQLPLHVVLADVNDDTYQVLLLCEAKVTIDIHDIQSAALEPKDFWPTDWRNLE